MNPRWLLCLYPRTWRDRYGDEVLALLESAPVTPGIVRDIVRGAAGEWAQSGHVLIAPILVGLRTLLGYYCATHLIWWVVASMEFLEFQPAGRLGWTPQGLLLSAAIQARAALVCATFVIGLGWLVMGPYPGKVRRWLLDLMPVIALFPMVVAVLAFEAAGIGPSREVNEEYFGDWMILAVGAHMWTLNWAIPTVRRWLDEPESLLPFMPKPGH